MRSPTRACLDGVGTKEDEEHVTVHGGKSFFPQSIIPSDLSREKILERVNRAVYTAERDDASIMDSDVRRTPMACHNPSLQCGGGKEENVEIITLRF